MRLARVDEAAFEIAQLARAWSSEGAGPLKIVGIKHPDGSIVYVVDAIRPIPPLVPMLFSEAINHLRSCMDNTLFHLVEAERGVVLSEVEAKRIAMPIHENESKLTKWLQDNDKKGLPELGADSLLGRRLRVLQPYVDPERILSMSEELAGMLGISPVRDAPLTLLQQYSNQDKHRVPITAAQRTSVIEGGGPFVGSDHLMEPRSEGDTVGSAAPGERGEIETNSAVCVQRPTSGAWVGPAREVSNLRRHVADFVLPTLVKGFALPSSLPPHLDLSGNGKLDRVRIEEGEWTPGDERATADALTAILASYEAAPNIPEIVGVEEYDPPGQ